MHSINSCEELTITIYKLLYMRLLAKIEFIILQAYNSVVTCRLEQFVTDYRLASYPGHAEKKEWPGIHCSRMRENLRNRVSKCIRERS